MLQIIQAEKIIAEEQADFRAGRSTTAQILNLRILCDKYFQHQEDLYHIFINFKEAFYRVWHAALWVTMRKYNISTNLIQVIKNLHNKATSAVLFNSSIGEWSNILSKSTQASKKPPPPPPHYISHPSWHEKFASVCTFAKLASGSRSGFADHDCFGILCRLILLISTIISKYHRFASSTVHQHIPFLALALTRFKLSPCW